MKIIIFKSTFIQNQKIYKFIWTQEMKIIIILYNLKINKKKLFFKNNQIKKIQIFFLRLMNQEI